MEIQNKEIVSRIADEAKIQQLEVPTTLNKTIQPVLISNPTNNFNFSYSANSTASGNSTLGTTHSTKRTFMTGASISFSKDAANNMVTTGRGVYLQVEDAVLGTLILVPIAVITLTEENGSMFVNFPQPIELKKGTDIILSQGAIYTEGIMAKSSNAWGYEIDSQ